MFIRGQEPQRKIANSFSGFSLADRLNSELNEQVRRNSNRFPDDFLFRLNRSEWLSVKSQLADELRLKANRSQIATGSGRHRDVRFLPYAFTEHGAIMAANVLNSPRAVQMSVFVVRAFVKMRELLGGNQELARQLKELEAKLTARLDGHEAAIVDVLRRIMRLLEPAPEPEPPKRQIGFRSGPEKPAAAVKGRKPFAEWWAKYKAEEKALEDAKLARLPFKRSR